MKLEETWQHSCTANIKYKKFAKNFKIKISKICSTVFAYWHIDHVCQVSWESEKNCRRTSDLKKVWGHIQTDVRHPYYRLRWLQAAMKLKSSIYPRQDHYFTGSVMKTYMWTLSQDSHALSELLGLSAPAATQLTTYALQDDWTHRSSPMLQLDTAQQRFVPSPTKFHANLYIRATTLWGIKNVAANFCQ